jgi:S-formylglutathione hydrolase FrmB
MTRRSHRPTLLVLLLCAALALIACDPLAPVVTPTAQIIIVTPEPSDTPPPTDTPAATATPTETPTPEFTPTPTAPPCDEDSGQIIAFDDFRSAVAGENLRYRVYIPPCYLSQGRRYPVVYLLHGLRERETQWTNIGVIEALEQGMRLGVLGPMILVMPYFGAIGAENSFPPNRSYETVILEELLPAIERDFCTWNDRAYRAIGGISRGGFWAFSIAMRHPDIFGAAGGHSASFTADNAPAANNPLELALNAPFLSQANLRMYLDNAAADPAGTNLELFSSRLSSRGIPHTYVIHPTGGHNDDYWAAHVAQYLSFYGADWPRSAADLPSCLEPSP